MLIMCKGFLPITEFCRCAPRLECTATASVTTAAGRDERFLSAGCCVHAIPPTKFARWPPTLISLLESGRGEAHVRCDVDRLLSKCTPADDVPAAPRGTQRHAKPATDRSGQAIASRQMHSSPSTTTTPTAGDAGSYWTGPTRKLPNTWVSTGIR
jgi:hypothetical protein